MPAPPKNPALVCAALSLQRLASAVLLILDARAGNTRRPKGYETSKNKDRTMMGTTPEQAAERLQSLSDVHYNEGV